jgi:hypothetical protein
MPKACNVIDCPLDSESGDTMCVIHSRRDRKRRDDLLPAFAKLEQHGVIRIHRAYLRDADLSGLSLSLKNLRDSELTGVTFDDARFDRVGFDGSCLNGVSFERAILQRCDLRGVTGLKGCRWYETILDGVRLRAFHRDLLHCGYLDGETPEGEKAQYVFRTFKEVYKREGDQDAAGLFYEREMDMKRRLSTGINGLWYTALWMLCGYGERPIRTVAVFMFSILAYAGIYTRMTLHGPEGPITGDFLEALYFSTITFTTLGYGDIRPEGLAKLVAGSEALVGLFTVSLFIFVFCRRMVR